MKSFWGFLALVGLAIFLTKGVDVKRSCKNSAVAYFVVQQHARQQLVEKSDIVITDITTPTMQDTSIGHSYLGACRHFFRAHLEVNEQPYPYEAMVVGFTEDEGKHTIEKFTWLEKILPK